MFHFWMLSIGDTIANEVRSSSRNPAIFLFMHKMWSIILFKRFEYHTKKNCKHSCGMHAWRIFALRDLDCQWIDGFFVSAKKFLNESSPHHLKVTRVEILGTKTMERGWVRLKKFFREDQFKIFVENFRGGKLILSH